MKTIIFKYENGGDRKISAVLGTNILTLAQQAQVDLDAPCAGNGQCGKCRLRLISGAVESTPDLHLSEDEYCDGWRLACRSSVCGNAILLVPAASCCFKNSIRTADLSSPQEMKSYQQSVSRIFAAGIERGCKEQGIGLAVDIGTTTVTAALLELDSGHIIGKASVGNGQIRYGADVINRIIQSSREHGREKLQHAVREETIYPLIEEMCTTAGIAPAQISRCVLAGNTTMEHLFVGVDAQSIRLEPYVPAFLELRGKNAADLFLPFAPSAPVIFAPNVGSYVGGDITAGTLTSMIWHDDKLSLFIDIGTNGEIVFGSAEFMLCCACSAGPAFEGGDIDCGMRATAGAIESCTIDEDTLEPHFGLVGDATQPAGICGSGLIDVVAELFRCGALSANGKFIRKNERIVRDEYGSARYVLAEARGMNGREIYLDETDIDNFIRAKGAIFSAIHTMLNSLELTVDSIEQVIIAGGIGSGINIVNAIRIGMLPSLSQEKYCYIGNSSLIGACAMLLSDAAVDTVFDIAYNMTYLDLSTSPGYMDEFIASCFLPHTDASLFNMEGD